MMKHLAAVGTISVLFLLLSIVGWRILGSASFIASSVIIVAALASVQVLAYRTYRLVQTLTDEQRGRYQQIESLFSLFSLIRVTQPLPSMGGAWTIRPDFANVIVALIREHKPKLILEAGSGVSTLVAAYALRSLGEGRIISLEHEQHCLATSQKSLERHGLDGIATIKYAPLKEVTIGGDTWVWYDTASLLDIPPIDMMVVDGPPGHLRKLARYPALPLLFEALNDNAVVLLDDVCRPDEQHIVDLWVREFDCLESEGVDTVHGAVILRKTPTKALSCSGAEPKPIGLRANSEVPPVPPTERNALG